MEMFYVNVKHSPYNSYIQRTIYMPKIDDDDEVKKKKTKKENPKAEEQAQRRKKITRFK